MSEVAVLAGVAALLFAARSSTALGAGYVGGVKVGLQLRAINIAGHQLRDDAARAFLSMMVAAALEGVALQVNSAFRTNEQQQALYDAWVAFQAGTGPKANLAAKPGFGPHQAGTAVDVESDNGRNAAFHWLTANAARFKFKRTVPSEPWHWEYFG